MKKIVALLVFSQLAIFLFAQNLQPLGSGLSKITQIGHLSVSLDGQHMFINGGTFKHSGQELKGMIWLENGIPQSTPFNEQFYSLKKSYIHDNALYIVGTSYQGPMEIRRWDGNEWTVIGPGMDPVQKVNSMIWFENRLWVGGVLQRIGNTTVSSLCAWDGNTWAAETPDVWREVYGLKVSNDSLLVWGIDMNAQFRFRYMHQGVWSEFPLNGLPNFYNAPLLHRFSGNWIFDGLGSFFRLNGNEWEKLPWNNNYNHQNFMVGDRLYLVNNEVYELKPDGQLVEVVRPQNGTINAVVPDSTGFWIGGSFTRLNGQEVPQLVHYSNGSLQGLNQYYSRTGSAYSFCLYRDTSSGDVLVGGEFTYAGEVYSPGIARWTGQEWQSMSKGFNNRVRRILRYQGQLYAVGSFTKYNSQPCKYVARWNGADWEPAGPPDLDDVVRDAVEWNGKLYICGDFSWDDHHIAVFDGNQWAPAGPDPDTYTYMGYRLKVLDDQLYVGFESGGLFRTDASGMWESLGGLRVIDFVRFQGKIYAARLNQGVYMLHPDLQWEKVDLPGLEDVWRVFVLDSTVMVSDNELGTYRLINGQWEHFTKTPVTDILPDGENSFILAGFIYNLSSGSLYEPGVGIARLVGEKPIARGAASATQVCVGEVLELHGGYREVASSAYQWTIPGAVSSTFQERDIYVSFLTPGLYPVQLIVSNAFGVDTIQLPEIKVLDCGALPDATGHWAQWPVIIPKPDIITLVNVAYEQPFETKIKIPFQSPQYISRYLNAFINDSEGDALLFADYKSVFDRNGKILLDANGESLITGMQSALFLPAPGQPDRYYLFYSRLEAYDVDPDTSHNWRYSPMRLNYMLIDASVDTALQVLESNVVVLEDTLLSGILQAVPHGNGHDWWIIHHAASSKDFYVGLLTNDGLVSMNTVNGQYHLEYSGYFQTAFSPDGRWLATVRPNEQIVYLWSFDRCNGILAPVAEIALPQSALEAYVFRNYYKNFGVAFSPENKYLFIGRHSTLFRVDVTSADPASTLETIDVDVVAGYAAPHFLKLVNVPSGSIWAPSLNGSNEIKLPDAPNPTIVPLELMLSSGNINFIPNIPQYLALKTPLACRNDQPVVGTPVLFPNPGDGHFYIDFPEKMATGQMARLQLFSATGNTVFEASMPLLDRTAVDFPATLPPGVYYLHIVSGEQKFIFKAVVQR